MQINRQIYLAALLSPLAAACGPSSEEVQARQILEPSVLRIFRGLPHPQIAPGYSSFTIGGTYHALEAEIHAEYMTIEPAEKICIQFFQVIKQGMGFERTPFTGEACGARSGRGAKSYSFHAQKNGRLILVDFSATEETIKDTRRTRVKMWLVHFMDKEKWGECAPDDAGRIKSFCNRGWGRNLEPPNVRTGSDRQQ